MSFTLSGISSMATRRLLAELADAFRRAAGVAVAFESVGGVDAAKRVQAGEAFDIVVLAADAIDTLVAAQRVAADGRTDVARSPVAVAVRAGAPRPNVSSEEALRRAVLAARSIGYSTGPSGVALVKLLERWSIAGAVRERLAQAPPGVPVGRLVAEGKVELGFQQLSELIHLEGIDVVGTLPPGAEIVTIFSAGLCTASRHPVQTRTLLEFLRSPATADAKHRHGMAPT